MRRAAIFFFALVAFGFISCGREPYGTITHRGRDGRPDQWVYRIDKDNYKISIDTNDDGRPDVVKTFKDNELVRIESDRNFDGRVDLVQEYSRGVLTASPRPSKDFATVSWRLWNGTPKNAGTSTSSSTMTTPAS